MLKMPKLSFFSSKKLPLIGIDITSSAIKLLEIHPYGNKLQVASYGVALLEEGAVIDRRIKNEQSVARSIKHVIEKTQPSTQRTAVAVPTAAVITRTLSLPIALSDNEMEALIMLEAEQHIPHPLNEVAIDFQRQRPLNLNDENQPVLLVACRKEVTNQLDCILDAAGLEPLVTDVEKFAMERSLGLIINKLPKQQTNQIVAVADIGAHTSTLNVLHDGEIIYSREQMFGGKQLTDNIQQYYGLSGKEADYFKKKGDLPADYSTTLLKPFKAALIQQIERQLQLFYSSMPYQAIDSLILAGGSSAIENLPQRLQKQLGCPTYIANPFVDMVLSDKVNAQALAQDAPAMMIACGLAMRVWV
ncbi:MAG TPA: type IV pilus assembly protein PilM [Marinospirillum sp.]|uniref:type IV pilus assembly protein PilM n=1 Tax=Marinospirillum sp. TaxID=2183934 RepID=UPI002B49FF81|nr:type IV pilus assembly protein PilM [Marinospirillum sp.]HKM16558.1 type IV pilus assembly protein PilM [Marinospirillum sp.]